MEKQVLLSKEDEKEKPHRVIGIQPSLEVGLIPVCNVYGNRWCGKDIGIHLNLYKAYFMFCVPVVAWVNDTAGVRNH